MPPEELISPPQSTTHSRLQHYPPPPANMLNMPADQLSHLESIHDEKNFPPPQYPHEPYLPRLQEGDEFYLGSDEEDDWDDFEEVCFNVFFRLLVLKFLESFLFSQ